jgi:hypothetical protein
VLAFRAPSFTQLLGTVLVTRMRRVMWIGILLAIASMQVEEAVAADPPLSASARRVLVRELVAKHGRAQEARLARGISQVAALWREEDGDLAAFARQQFLADARLLDSTFARLEWVFEQLDGHMLEARRALNHATDLDLGPLLPVDPPLSGLEPAAHLTEDLFRSKVAFVALLNFPQTTLAERLAHGGRYTRRQWAEQRLTGRFDRRIPPELFQRQAEIGAQADLYISEYNLWMHHVLDEQGRRLFPKGKRLISHWNLRDELKSAYSDPEGRARQRVILTVMDRIVTQSIPAAVIDNPRLDWNPFTNGLDVAPVAEVETDAPDRPARPDAAREPDTRYTHLLAQFRAARALDPYSPTAPDAIRRSFELGREIPEARVRQLFTEVLTSPLVPRVAAEIERRLGRKLEPQDLWYDGFKARAAIPEAELDAITRKRYPDAGAFAADLPRILRQLGFAADKASFLAEHVVVDPSRGAGHAQPAARRGDRPHLRTRIEKGGMNYKGYNIAIHELGHNVEQVFSLYGIDHTLLQGVPNNAFTEALAFVFQAHDLELLGLSTRDAEATRLAVLNDFWQTWEIAGVALVDVASWRWMYEHPEATAAETREAVVRIARETWDRWYAPVLGGKGSALLGIYSHMVANPLYLPDYPLGHLIAFQIEEKIARSRSLGTEFERMARLGNITPDLWMTKATGAPLSASPLLRATAKALGKRPASSRAERAAAPRSRQGGR